jgi:hypothetical protein
MDRFAWLWIDSRDYGLIRVIMDRFAWFDYQNRFVFSILLSNNFYLFSISDNYFILFYFIFFNFIWSAGIYNWCLSPFICRHKNKLYGFVRKDLYVYPKKKETLISIAQPCISRDFHLYFEYFDARSLIHRYSWAASCADGWVRIDLYQKE